MYSLVLLIIIILILLWLASKQREKFAITPIIKASGSTNYVKLYEDFAWKDLLYGLSNSTPTMKYLKYAIRAPVKSIDINLPNAIVDAAGHPVKVELWNVRELKGLESSQSDFYENTIYTTPAYLRQVTGNLTKIADVGPGQRLKINDLSPIQKILIVAYL